MEIRQLAIGQSQSGQSQKIGYRWALALVKLGPGGLASRMVFASAKRALVKPVQVKRAQMKPCQLALVELRPKLSKTVLVWRRVASRGWETSAHRPKRPDRWRMEVQEILGRARLEARFEPRFEPWNSLARWRH
jgi:hypothetical protein